MSTVALDNYVSVTEAAEMLDLTVGRVRQLLISGEIHGKKATPRAWLIDLKELERFAKSVGKTLHSLA